MCRWSEVSGRLLLSPLQLAVLERKREVVTSLVKGLTTQQLVQAVTNRVVILEDKVQSTLIGIFCFPDFPSWLFHNRELWPNYIAVPGY